MRRLIRHETVIEIHTYPDDDKGAVVIDKQTTDHISGTVIEDTIRRSLPLSAYNVGQSFESKMRECENAYEPH